MTKSIIDRELRIAEVEASSIVRTDYCTLIPLGNDPEEPFCGETSNEEFALFVGANTFDVFVEHEELDGTFLDVTISITGVGLKVGHMTYDRTSDNDGSDLSELEKEVALALSEFYGLYD